MRYRADIDGLRSVAIIPVVLYHAGISMFSGGYVGVDIFFVISGYLITSIILNDINKDKFTITSFYFRRIKRIFPALYFFFIVTSIFCWFFYMPADLKAYGKSLFGSVFFISNIVFWRESGYFDTASELKPLLHTWSLSVEEQFYIFFPVMMIILAKYFRKKYTPVVLAIFVMSFLVSVWATPKMPSASFFLLPTRAWELMLGCLLALGFFPKTKNIKALNLLSLAGIAMIFVSIFAYKHSTPFPGYAAFLPCLGTALIIYSGSFGEIATGGGAKPLINKLISWKPFVLVGLVSYSWYLWHWPVFAFRHYYNSVTVDMFIKSNWFLIPFTLLMAIVSYFLVEKPFRDIKWENRYKLFAYSAAVMVLFAGFGLLAYKEDGFKNRFSEEISRVNDSVNDNILDKYVPDLGMKYLLNQEYYTLGDKSSEPSFVIWGDSHAWALAPGIGVLAEKEGKSGYLLVNGGTLPLLNIQSKGNSKFEYVEQSLELILSMDSIQTVFLGARWSNYLSQPFLVILNDNKYSYIKEHDEILLHFEKELSDIIRILTENNKKVVFLSSVPQADEAVPLLVARAKYMEIKFPVLYQPNIFGQEIESFNKMQEHVFGVLENFKANKELEFSIVYLHKPLCNNNLCRFASDDLIPYLYDDDHLSTYGAKFVCEELKDEIIPWL